jgi:cytochrome bd-type quinol oxidase subunit 2
MKTLLIVGVLAVILYQLGAGLYFMMKDKGTTNRTLHALTKRIALSVALILGVAVGIATGVIKPHGVEGPRSSAER